MNTIHARNVNEAWAKFHLLMGQGATREVRPRGLQTEEVVGPVMTTYTCPEECVLVDPVRDCNPFFHLYESMWMLTGRNDVSRVKFYSPQIATYSDDTEVFHGAYGHRWRAHFGIDQLVELTKLLRKDPDTRRAVLQMWDADDLRMAELGRDVPCNTAAYFLLRDGALHITVTNRSNDAVWGCFGANAVQFSILLQFMAAAVGADIGTYTQVSNSLHVYLEGNAGEVWRRCAGAPPPLLQDYTPPEPHVPLIEDWRQFILEAYALTSPEDGSPGHLDYQEPWMRYVAAPMCVAHWLYRNDNLGAAMKALSLDGAPDDPWIVAGREWLERRISKREQATTKPIPKAKA